jgi:hypothetical protein
MTMLRGLVRGYRRLVATIVAPQSCPICLELVPVLALQDVESESDEAHAKLHCRHRFCAGRRRGAASIACLRGCG